MGEGTRQQASSCSFDCFPLILVELAPWKQIDQFTDSTVDLYSTVKIDIIYTEHYTSIW